MPTGADQRAGDEKLLRGTKTTEEIHAPFLTLSPLLRLTALIQRLRSQRRGEPKAAPLPQVSVAPAIRARHGVR